MKLNESPIGSPKSINYSNPNEHTFKVQQQPVLFQQPVKIRKTFSQMNEQISNRSSVNSENLHTKIPKVIFQQIGQRTRQQNQDRIRNSRDLTNKKSLLHKSRKSAQFSKNRNSDLFQQEEQVNEDKAQPTGAIRKSIAAMKLPNMESMRTSKNISCPICLSEGKKKEFISISGNECDHMFCRSCMHQYVIFKIKMFEKVTCPDQGCNVDMKIISDLYAQLPLDTRQKFKKITQYNQVLDTKTKRICPNQTCSGLLDISNPQINPRCSSCKKVYCKKCYFPNHAGQCATYQLNFFSQTLNYRQCARCQNMIQKNEGCNHMTCRCGYQFCYLCGEKWKSSHNCEGLGEQPLIRDTWECCCCECQECGMCQHLDYLCECFCFDDWEICEIRPIRYLGKFLVLLLLLAIGLPLWIAYMVVSFVLRLLMGIVMGLFIIPCSAIFSEYDNGSWILLAILVLPLTIPALIFFGIKEVFSEEMGDLIDELCLPCEIVNEIIQL